MTPARWALAALPILGGVACETGYLNVGHDLPDECPGQCVPLPPLGFDGPALLWFGPAEEVPECPARAPTLVFQGFDGLQDTPLECPECDCSQPVCAFPEALATHQQPLCQGNTVDFPAPQGWSGSCVAPASIFFSGSGSVRVGATSEQPCAPVADAPQKGNPGPDFTVVARGCAGEAITDVCQDPGHTCMPTAEPPPPGFRQCIMYTFPDDDAPVECPEDFPEVHRFYSDVDDGRECTECTCTQTATSMCVARLATFTDASCSAGSEIFSTTVGDLSLCNEVMPGMILRGMSATWMVNQPGACQASGGESVGAAVPRAPRTFCCQAPP